jgi:hypothetical protein
MSKGAFTSTEARRAYEKHIRNNGRRMGAPVDAIYIKGGVELMLWLVEATPENVTIAETLAAIALDAMHEEKEP